MAKKKGKSTKPSRSAPRTKSKPATRSPKSGNKPAPQKTTKQASPNRRRVPSAAKNVSNLTQQRKSLISQQRSLERKFERETRKTYADKLRRELKAVEKSLQSVRDQIPKERVRVKQQVALRKEKGAIYSQRYRLNKKMRALYESGGQAKSAKEYEKLSNKYNYLGGKLRDINRELGYEVARPKAGPQEFEGGAGGGGAAGAITETSPGFFREPNPLASWQVQGHLKDKLASGDWTAITVDGVRYEKSDPVGEIMLRMAVANFAKDVYKEGSDVQVEVSFNPESGEIIYDIAR